jgi:hypothetical protein
MAIGVIEETMNDSLHRRLASRFATSETASVAPPRLTVTGFQLPVFGSGGSNSNPFSPLDSKAA